MQIQFKKTRMNISLIKTESEYKRILKRFEMLFDSTIGSPEGDEAEILALIIDEYENKNHPICKPDPIEAIKIRMQEMELKRIDLIELIGGESRVSAILNKRRKLTVEMIRNLTTKLNISASLLITDYPLNKEKILNKESSNIKTKTTNSRIKVKRQNAKKDLNNQVIDKLNFNNVKKQEINNFEKANRNTGQLRK